MNRPLLWLGCALALSMLCASGNYQFQSVNGVQNPVAFTGVDIGAQINNAIAALGVQGGRIDIPAGAYTYSTTIQCPVSSATQAQVILQGQSRSHDNETTHTTGTLLKYTGSGDAVNDFTNTNQNIAGCVLRDLTLDGSGASGSAVGVHFGGTEYTGFENINIRSFPGPGVKVENGSNGMWTERDFADHLTLWHDNPTGPMWLWQCDSGCSTSFGHFDLHDVHINVKGVGGTSWGFGTTSLGTQKAFVYDFSLSVSGNIEGTSGDGVFKVGTSGDTINNGIIDSKVECNEASCIPYSIVSGGSFNPVLNWMDATSLWAFALPLPSGFSFDIPDPGDTYGMVSNVAIPDHLRAAGGDSSMHPTLSACGTSPSLTTGSNDSFGTVILGTGAAGTCTFTFHQQMGPNSSTCTGNGNGGPETIWFTAETNTVAVLHCQTAPSGGGATAACGDGSFINYHCAGN